MMNDGGEGDQPTEPPTGTTQPARRRFKPITIAAGLVAVAAIVAGVVLLFPRHDTTNGTAPAVPSQPAPTTSLPDTVDSITVPATIPGWQGVWFREQRLAYDVPPDWLVETPGTFVAFPGADGKLAVDMHGVSIYEHDVCPEVSGSQRGMVGFVVSADAGLAPGDDDLAHVAANVARVWVQHAVVNSPHTTAGAPDPADVIPVNESGAQQIVLDGGTIQASRVQATAQPPLAPCASPSEQATAVAFRMANKVVVFLAVMDQQVPDALSQADLTKVILSIRPHG